MKLLKVFSIVSIFSVTLISSSFSMERDDTIHYVIFSRNVLKLYKSGVLEDLDPYEIAQDFPSKYPSLIENIAELGVHISHLEGQLAVLERQNKLEGNIPTKYQQVESSSKDIYEKEIAKSSKETSNRIITSLCISEVMGYLKQEEAIKLQGLSKFFYNRITPRDIYQIKVIFLEKEACKQFVSNVLSVYEDGILEEIDIGDIAQDFPSKYPSLIENLEMTALRIKSLREIIKSKERALKQA